jgi:pimeloyl-ACP methyl ester carboxylesterase
MSHDPQLVPGLRPTRRDLFAAVALALLAGPGAARAAGTPAAGGGAVAGPVGIGGRSLFLTRAGRGQPTVVLDAGLGADSRVWAGVIPLVAGTTRVCAYDRAGEGQSPPAPGGRRTLADAVADLRALLAAAALPGPYELVGHSVGGMVARLFASTHPREVAGVVLVEATTENWSDASLARHPELRGLLTGGNPEHLDLLAGEAQLRSAAKPPAVPAVVLQRDPARDDPSDPTNAVWHADQRALAAAWGARFVTAPGTDHEVPAEAPSVVARAILDVVAAVRNPTSRRAATPAATP